MSSSQCKTCLERPWQCTTNLNSTGADSTLTDYVKLRLQNLIRYAHTSSITWRYTLLSLQRRKPRKKSNLRKERETLTREKSLSSLRMTTISCLEFGQMCRVSQRWVKTLILENTPPSCQSSKQQCPWSCDVYGLAMIIFLQQRSRMIL